jgi:hypothetical protein
MHHIDLSKTMAVVTRASGELGRVNARILARCGAGAGSLATGIGVGPNGPKAHVRRIVAIDPRQDVPKDAMIMQQ